MILTTWFDHEEKSSSYKEILLNTFSLSVKTVAWGLAYEGGRDVCQKFLIKPLRETDLSVGPSFF